MSPNSNVFLCVLFILLKLTCATPQGTGEREPRKNTLDTPVADFQNAADFSASSDPDFTSSGSALQESIADYDYIPFGITPVDGDPTESNTDSTPTTTPTLSTTPTGTTPTNIPITFPMFDAPTDSEDTSNDTMKSSREGSAELEDSGGYEFEWEVNHPESKNQYSMKETGDENGVRGEYRVLLPDGRTQIVTYSDTGGGYVAKVTYIRL